MPLKPYHVPSASSDCSCYLAGRFRALTSPSSASIREAWCTLAQAGAELDLHYSSGHSTTPLLAFPITLSSLSSLLPEMALGIFAKMEAGGTARKNLKEEQS